MLWSAFQDVLSSGPCWGLYVRVVLADPLLLGGNAACRQQHGRETLNPNPSMVGKPCLGEELVQGSVKGVKGQHALALVLPQRQRIKVVVHQWC